MLLLTLFMSPSEDRTSQTVTKRQPMFNYVPSKPLVDPAGVRDICDGIVSMRM